MKNPRTNIYGAIFIAFLAVSIKPDLVDFLPKGIADYIKGFSIWISVVAGMMGYKNTPDVDTVKKQNEILNDKIESVIPEKKSSLKVYE